MRRIDAYRQMGFLLQKRHSRYIKSISCHCLKGAYASFAEDNVHISTCHDVFGRHEKLLQCVCQTALEQYGLVALS